MPKNTRSRIAKQLHSERLKKIRPFVKFNYDLRQPLTAAAKRKIKLYYDEITALTNRPFQVYRPRTTGRLRPAQEFAQHEKFLPELKVAFVPNDGSHRFKLKFTRKGITASNRHVTQFKISLSTRALLRDAVGHVTARVRPHKTAKSFTIQAGRYEIPASFDRSRIAHGVARFVARYNDESSNHYFGRWLHGVFAYTFHNQESLQQYLVEKQKRIRINKRARRATRRKQERARDSGG